MLFTDVCVGLLSFPNGFKTVILPLHLVSDAASRFHQHVCYPHELLAVWKVDAPSVPRVYSVCMCVYLSVYFQCT